MNKTRLLIGSLVILLIVFGASLILCQKSNNPNSCDIKSQSQELNLINNEYTKNLSKLPDDWKTYENKSYGFQINYPEEFNENKIDAKDVSFKDRNDLATTGQEGEIPTASMGSFKTVKEIISFNSTVNKWIDGKMFKTKDSLFAIGIHPNESNLSFKEFVSQEILSYYKGSEIIKSQEIVEVNGTEGYKFTYNPTEGSNNITYYFPSKDNKTIVSLNTHTELLSEVLKSDDIFFEFSKINPQFKIDLEKGTFMDNGYDEFLKKYPDYRLFEKDFSVKYLQKEKDKELAFAQIVDSFRF